MQGRLPVVAIIVAALAIGAGIAWYRQAPAPPELRAGTALPESRPLPDFALVDQDGNPLGRSQLAGRWTLVFTGFTHCPDVCPLTLAMMAGLRTQVARDDVGFLFVSVDPERDTPEVVRDYVAHFDPSIDGATGARGEIERFTGALGLAQVRNPGTGGDYTVDHSTALVLINPEARLAGYFRAPHDPGAIAADLAGLK